MKKYSTIKIETEFKEKIDKEKPEWMSYTQWFRNARAPVGEEDESRNRWTNYGILKLDINGLVTIWCDDLETISRINSHVSYLRKNYDIGLGVHCERSKGRFLVTVTRTR